MQKTQQTLEIELEELDQSFWRSALANSLTGAFGSANFRFVGRVVSGDDTEDVIGAAFPMMRFESLDGTSEPSASTDIAKDRLRELDRALQQAGWQPAATRGRNWWSLRYTKDHAAR